MKDLSPINPTIAAPIRVLVSFLLLAGSLAQAATYYVHPLIGDDQHSGTSKDSPWKTLGKASAARLKAGDQVLLAGGQTFQGQLAFDGLAGTAEAPIVFSSYAASANAGEARATIDAKGFLAAVHLSNSRHIRIADLVVTADGGGWHSGQPQSDMRCGVLIDADAPGHYEDLQLTNLLVKEVSLNEPGFVRPKEDVNTANGTVGYGWGIRFMVTSSSAQMRDISVLDSVIENVNHTGLKFTAPSNGIQQVNVERVRVLHSGGPGMQMSGVRGGHFSGLYVNGSGSTNDTRNWGRGSGLWTWTSSDIIIEKSQFLNANGPGDSAGVHIDYNCRNVVVQYNLSANNAGGFCEILGNNYNNAYRYNVSINDGSRVKGENGAMQEGKTFWLSGYTGNKSPRSGPYNSYFYNNTIYVSAEHVAKIAVAPTSEGVLIANNIFYVKGRSQLVKGDQSRPDDGRVTSLQNIVFENNLYLQAANWPKEVMIQDRAPIIGNPEFRNAGGLRLEDYAPQNASLIRNRGIRIPRIPNDTVGLTAGLDLDRDILGNKISGRPDLGAVEVSPDARASLKSATASNE